MANRCSCEEDQGPSERFMAEVIVYFEEQQNISRPIIETNSFVLRNHGKLYTYTTCACTVHEHLLIIIWSSNAMYFYAGIYHGNTIALQSHDRAYWLGCPSYPCDRRYCPLVYMRGSEWNSCWGEVFQIYRASGPGQVRVGDLVGLHYPHEYGQWLGCAGSECAKANCPGYPSTPYGFTSEEHWYTCWGEVFKIYAHEKTTGAPIFPDDDIMLYYLQGGVWVSLGYDNVHKQPCPGTVRPPPHHRFDACAWENFKIWKRL